MSWIANNWFTSAFIAVDVVKYAIVVYIILELSHTIHEEKKRRFGGKRMT